MPTHYVAVGCRNSHRAGDGKRFFRFPTAKYGPERRAAWVRAVKRAHPTDTSKPWVPSKQSRLCGAHFVMVPTRPPQGDSTLADPLQTGASPDLSPLSEGPDEVSVRDPWTQQHLQGMEQGTAITLTTNHLNNEKLSALQKEFLTRRRTTSASMRRLMSILCPTLHDAVPETDFEPGDPGYEARIASLMNLCVVRYVTNARTINWRRLTTFAAACEQYLRSVKKKKKRKAVRELLRSRKTLGEYATIVRYR
ncbi:hypothetical protein HPB47_014317 [Ixodes persulcatus]|uniref:Uncharacterized protein n=1 Tax=Ixodes persulcatus TaxID=34615 RepID=A0AC60QZW7_IXOPE|nr:hypothetical protein HPB47_014317 [Ixodes persulcatus]